MLKQCVLFPVAALCAAFSTAAAERADLVLHNGKIVTVDAGFKIASAMAVAGERILAVGGNAEVLRLAGPKTRRIDLKGKTVLPGLIDSHVHSIAGAMHEFDHPIPEMLSIADVLAYIKARTQVVPEGSWISLSQVFITRLREQRFPSRAELDSVAPRHPVVFATGPDAALNSLALRLSGIDKDFKITDGLPGRIERDPNTGELTGLLRSCSRFIKSRSAGGKKATDEDRIQRMKILLADYNSVGITSIADRDASDAEVELYRKMKERGDLTCRVFVNYSLPGQASIEKIGERVDAVVRDPLHQYNNMLWIRGTKVYLDGGMLTGSAYMLLPWGVSKLYGIEDPAYRGMKYIEPGKLYQIARLAMQKGLQPTAHTVGDGAVHALIDAYEEVNNAFPVRGHRPCISHSNFMSLEAIQRMKRTGIVADIQPAWLWLDGATLLKQFGYDRLAYFQPYKTIFDHGVIVGGGSDHMQKIGRMRSNNPYDPFLGIWITQARQPRWGDKPLHPEQRITREQAIRFYTINNAFLTFEEKEKGSLEKGKLADFIVLDRDILTCPEDAIRTTQVELTYLGGRQVHPRP